MIDLNLVKWSSRDQAFRIFTNENWDGITNQTLTIQFEDSFTLSDAAYCLSKKYCAIFYGKLYKMVQSLFDIL